MRRVSWSVAAILSTTLLLTLPCPAQQPKYPIVRSVGGAAIFRDYCASCHGTDGRGHGPVAAAFKGEVPDLTLITKRAGGEFPRARIRNIIEGKESPVPHGSREMPVWGPVFHQIDNDRDMGNVRIDNLALYIQSIQQK
jgi:mono/diheme cytochrome c family protein